MKQDLLFELGCEELPAKQVATLAKHLCDAVQSELTLQKFEQGPAQIFATPRRLAFLIKAVSNQSATQQQKKIGPLVVNAFDPQGNPLPAALGFAKSCGVELSQLEKEMTPKGEAFVFLSALPPQSLSAVFQEMLNRALSKLPLPKKMRWGNQSQGFLRPVKWIVALHGNEVLPVSLFGLHTTAFSYGHRLAKTPTIKIDAAADYETILEKACVVVNAEKRKALIQKQINMLTTVIKGHVDFDQDLLEEVTYLVEWPQSLIANFDQAFLKIPPEVLITSMKNHQKCFAIRDEQHKLLPAFAVVSNQPFDDLSHIKAGNEKVMRARLKDATFFYENDQKIHMQARIELLNKITFQEKLGSLYKKTERNVDLAKKLAPFFNVNPKKAEAAAWLLKADLTSDMVNEFPELQGIMGDYYARADHDVEIATAIREHYLPRFAGDQVPETALGSLLAVVDKVDTLYSFFTIGLQPKADKDPFGLRRMALGIARILFENERDFDLAHAITESFQAHHDHNNPNQVSTDVCLFMKERLKSYLLESGVLIHIVNAASDDTYNFLIIKKRIATFEKYIENAKLLDLIGLNKRINNILKERNSENINPVLLKDPAEKTLFSKINILKEQCDALEATRNYEAILERLLELQAPIADFFDAVMVMDEDFTIRENRLGLLQRARKLMQMAGNLAALSQ